MLFIQKTRNTRGGWTWHLGQVTLASSYTTTGIPPGLFYFSIRGVHKKGAELFSTHPRAEALLAKHVGCDATFGEQAVAQSLSVDRQASWVKMQRTDPPAREQDSYTYVLGNVVLAGLSNIKNIRVSGYHLNLTGPGLPPVTQVLSITEGERRLVEALGGSVDLRTSKVDYLFGPNHHPCEATDFACQPTLYDGRPAW